MIYLDARSVSSNGYGKDIFGANILASRDQIGEDGTYDDAVNALGVTHIRYPGGSLTEDYFDLSNPDKAVDIDPDTGRTVELLPYSEFMGYAEENDIDVTIVLPTRNYLSEETDADGHRYAAVDEDALRSFVQDTLSGEYGAPTIRAFEIGNEYWGSGEMDTLEYGRVSSEMARILDEELTNHPNAAMFDDVDVLVQNGQNYGVDRLSDDYDHLQTGQEQIEAINEDYGLDLDESYIMNSGKVSWARVANEVILSEFDTEEERDAVDGIIMHVYSKGEDKPNSREYDINTVEDTWFEELGELDTYITEWNLKASRSSWDPEEEYGLKQAHEMLNMTEVFVERGVDVAHVWAIQQNNLTNLAGDEGGDGELTVPGEMFRMMNESLEGTRPISFESDNDKEHEVTVDDTSVHGFYSEDRFVLFIASNTEDAQNATIDMTQILADSGTARIDVLGVEDGYNPTSPDSPAKVTSLDPDQVFEDGILNAELNGYEILRVEIQDPTFTDSFEEILNGTVEAEDTLEETDFLSEIHYAADAAADEDEDPQEEDEVMAPSAGDSDGGAMGGMGMVLALLPFLALLGAG